MNIQRRELLKSAAALVAAARLPDSCARAAAGDTAYPYLGRTEDYAEFRIIEPGLTLTMVESWTQGSYGIVRVTTNDGREGYGQLSSFEPDITATVLHRQVARHVLGSDPSQIDALFPMPQLPNAPVSMLSVPALYAPVPAPDVKSGSPVIEQQHPNFATIVSVDGA